jgi:hypothetical protein
MTEEVDADTTVSYTVRELFEGVNRRFDKQDTVLDGISVRMDGMATKEDLSKVHTRLDGVEVRVGHIESEQVSAAAAAEAAAGEQKKFRESIKWVIGAIAVPVFASLIVIVVQHH